MILALLAAVLAVALILALLAAVLPVASVLALLALGAVAATALIRTVEALIATRPLTALGPGGPLGLVAAALCARRRLLRARRGLAGRGLGTRGGAGRLRCLGAHGGGTGGHGCAA